MTEELDHDTPKSLEDPMVRIKLKGMYLSLTAKEFLMHTPMQLFVQMFADSVPRDWRGRGWLNLCERFSPPEKEKLCWLLLQQKTTEKADEPGKRTFLEIPVKDGGRVYVSFHGYPSGMLSSSILRAELQQTFSLLGYTHHHSFKEYEMALETLGAPLQQTGSNRISTGYTKKAIAQIHERISEVEIRIQGQANIIVRHQLELADALKLVSTWRSVVLWVTIPATFLIVLSAVAWISS